MSKKKLIAICGKSASGKDYMARQLSRIYTDNNVPFHNMVSCTTRPARSNEKDGIDYYFITPDEFLHEREKDNFLEYTMFRGWHYGTLKSELRDDVINIAVLNPTGLQALSRIRDDVEVKVFYLEAPLLLRLRRSIQREGMFHWEQLRRVFTDAHDFHNMKNTLDLVFPDAWVALYNEDVNNWLIRYEANLLNYRNNELNKLGLLF